MTEKPFIRRASGRETGSLCFKSLKTGVHNPLSILCDLVLGLLIPVPASHLLGFAKRPHESKKPKGIRKDEVAAVIGVLAIVYILSGFMPPKSSLLI